MSLYQNGSTPLFVNGGGFGFTGAAARTFSLWVYPVYLGQNCYYLYSLGVGNLHSFFLMEGVSASGDLHLDFIGAKWHTAGSLLTANAWNHVAVTYNGGAVQTSGNAKIFVNGASQSLTLTGASTGNANSDDTQVMVGSGYAGRMAELASWGAVLDDAEILALSGGCSPDLIRPQSRTQYCPLIRDAVPARDRWGTRHLGSYATLVVSLSGNANEYLIADAVRLEPLGAGGTVTTINDNSGSFSAPGWTYVSGAPYAAYYSSDVTFILGDPGNAPATWTSTTLHPGTWRVYVTWTPDPNRATNAAYSVLDGNGTVLATSTINQESTPPTNIGGTLWQSLGDLAVESFSNPYTVAEHPRVYYPGRGRRAIFVGGATGVTGTLAVTLDNLTCAATATVKVSASASVTLADCTLAGTGTVKVVGSTSTTLADLTCAATGTVAVHGSASATLDDCTAAATGAVKVAGTLDVTLDDLTCVGSSGDGATGDLSATLADCTLVGTAAVKVQGSGAVTLSDVTCATTATVKASASFAATLDDATCAATGTVKASGDVAVTLDSLTCAATATVRVTASAAITLGSLTCSATGGDGSALDYEPHLFMAL